MEYRNELKFLVADKDLELIRYRLQPLMSPDIHQNGTSYMVRSLYFDDYQDSCKRENEDGIGNRKKFRIRMYNADDTFIKLEQKIKCQGRNRKEAGILSRDECLHYMNGSVKSLPEAHSKQERELQMKIRLKGMHPVCIVEYERTAWVERKGNVRITFDRNIGGSSRTDVFLDKKIMSVPVLPSGVSILEIKYDALFPQYLYEALNIGILQRSAFSKYYYAREVQG
ncbi:MAG: polyphosphate polymerase domain-containing protein [Clostridium sp.]|nr:polyphosphate polymerase domain-containing protein [Clostridium sp.]